MKEPVFHPFRRVLGIFRERGATTPEKALTWKELGLPEGLESIRPPIPPEMNPIVQVGKKYYLSEERLAKFKEQIGLPSPIQRWIQHTAKVPKGFLRYRIMQKLREGSMSGAELASAIEDEMGGQWRPKPGSIYPILNSLFRDGLTQEIPDPDGRTRRYELTDKGMKFLKTEIDGCGELREKIEQGLSPFPGPFIPFLEDIEEIPSDILNLFQTLRRMSMIVMSRPSPEVLEELSEASKKFSRAVEKVCKKIELDESEV